jgi:predicted nucleic acid-binding protein
VTPTIDPHRLLVLDTNVLVHLLRRDATGQYLETSFALSRRPERPLLCSVVEGELRGLAAWWDWGAMRVAELEKAFTQLVRVSAGAPEVIRAYGELYAIQNNMGQRIGDNDLWIAATTRAVSGVLLTCDTDFQRIDQALVESIYVRPQR